MNKQKFLSSLKRGLSSLPKAELEERATFYDEMINDRIEEGMSEEEAVAAVGDVHQIISQILSEAPRKKMPQSAKASKSKYSATEIILLILGSPVWFSLLISFGAVCFSLYAVAWAVVISFWAAFAAFSVSAPSGILVASALIFTGNAVSGVALLSAALVCASLSIFAFFGCRELTKYLIIFTKKCPSYIKSLFKGRRESL